MNKKLPGVIGVYMVPVLMSLMIIAGSGFLFYTNKNKESPFNITNIQISDVLNYSVKAQENMEIIEKDSRRKADISTVNAAIKIALLDKQIELIPTSGCSTCTSNTGSSQVDGKSGWVKFNVVSGKTGLLKFLSELPIDPENSGDFVYTYTSDGDNYEIRARLKSPRNDKTKPLSKTEQAYEDNNNNFTMGEKSKFN